MKRYFTIGLVLILALSLGFIAWGAYLNVKGENTIAARMDNRRLALTGAQAKTRTITPNITLDQVQLTSRDMADAIALVDGRISEAMVKTGDTVAYGQSLFVLTNDDLPLKLKQTESDIARAQAELTRATNSYHRYSSLIEYNATSREKLDEAEASYRAALATLDAALTARSQVEVQMGRQTVTAPVAGSVILTYRNAGSYVSAGTALALVGNFDKLYIKVNMADVEASALAVGAPVNLLVHSSGSSSLGGGVQSTMRVADETTDRERFTGVVERITPPIGESADRREVEIRIDNPLLRLKPQTYRHVHIDVQHSVTCLTVPVSAMLDAKRDTVFVVAADGRLERRAVVTGLTDGDYIEIVSGLAEGDTVVTANTDGLDEGMMADITLEDE